MGNMLARTSHPMPTYLIWNENQSCRSSANARRNKTPKRDAETSKETLKKETECQYMDLHPTPKKNQTKGNRMPIHELTPDSKQHKGNRMPIHGLTPDSKQHKGNRMPIHGLISDSKRQHKQETECQYMDLYPTPNKQTQTGNRMLIHGLISDS